MLIIVVQSDVQKKNVKDVIKKGTVKIGEKETKNAVKNGNAKLIIVSNNCPYIKEINKIAKDKSIPVYNYSSSGIDLGYACGKNYSVSSFVVIDDGETSVMQLVKKGKQ